MTGVSTSATDLSTIAAGVSDGEADREGADRGILAVSQIDRGAGTFIGLCAA
jgi:hypothetical protein